MSDTYIIIGALLVFGVLVGLVAYLYREKAIVSGRSEIRIGPIRISLEGQAREEVERGEEERPAPSPPPGIRQVAVEGGRIVKSGPEIHGRKGQIDQDASVGGEIEDSPPKIL